MILLIFMEFMKFCDFHEILHFLHTFRPPASFAYKRNDLGSFWGAIFVKSGNLPNFIILRKYHEIAKFHNVNEVSRF